jgi:hypothetical protein
VAITICPAHDARMDARGAALCCVCGALRCSPSRQ